MAIAVENDDNKNEQKSQGEIIRQWLTKIQKSLDFIYNNKPEELSVEQVLSGDAKYKIFDPYSDLCSSPLKNRIFDIHGNRNKSNDLSKVCGGECVVRLKSGEELHGSWREGRRVGHGSLYGPRLEKVGVKHLTGYYDDGVLNGQGKIYMANSTIRDAWFSDGYCHGPCRGMTMDGRLDYVGWFKGGLATGFSWQHVRGEGWLVGCLDNKGKFTGEEIAYLYPDLETAILGKFEDGVLISGQPARVVSNTFDKDVLVPKFELTSEK
eukprot:TRINITY_DN4716_c0_g1_i9.p1 TRINITY_DN4716_c0_g1~~TRINITY_DN4716_c0_g1_i9.p1  ORF type:complete len:266 (+),score=51.09 TRINITY_DN4716_c0_g1_i9:36-833(+)